jgi:aldose 1-epimerase
MLTIDATGYTPVDDTLIPTGEIKKVEGTPSDFRKAASIGDCLQQVVGKPVGYDHNFVLNAGEEVRAVATVQDPKTGRVLTVSADQPGLQFYSGNFLDGTLTGEGGAVYQQYDALVLEPQHFPDSPNEPKLPQPN